MHGDLRTTQVKYGWCNQTLVIIGLCWFYVENYILVLYI